MDDSELLRRYIATRDESAFTELVQYHLGLVYNTALRRLNGDAHHAHDVSQAVFTLLARKAPALLSHPTLTGWLHATTLNTARQLIRAEQRRAAREEQTHAMQENPTPVAEVWQQLRPAIDDALSDLNAADRDALLLRYFENCTLAHVAATLRLSEDAARMRINRALEKLRTALARRGITSTAAALGTMLAPHTASSAPVGMATQISTAALAASAIPAGVVGSALVSLTLMSTAKTVSIIATATAILATTVAVHQHNRTSNEREIARTKIAALEQKISALEETHPSRTTPPAAQTSVPAFASPASARLSGSPDSREIAARERALSAARSSAVGERRFAQARKLAIEGKFEASGGKHAAGESKFAEALEAYLGCYADGYRNQRFFDSLAELGLQHPPALAALVQLRDKTENLMRLSPAEIAAAADLALINRALGNDQNTLAVFNSLAASDPRRTALLAKTTIYSTEPDDLVRPLFETLLKDRRYAELTQSISYQSMTADLASLNQTAERMTQRVTTDDAAKATLRTYVATSTAKNVEALAGSGKISEAQTLLKKLLDQDSSNEAIAIVRQHLARAGHPELLPPSTDVSTR